MHLSLCDKVSSCYSSCLLSPRAACVSFHHPELFFFPASGAGDGWLSFSQHHCHPILGREWDSFSPLPSFSWFPKTSKEAQLILMLFIGQLKSKQTKWHTLKGLKHPVKCNSYLSCQYDSFWLSFFLTTGCLGQSFSMNSLRLHDLGSGMIIWKCQTLVSLPSSPVCSSLSLSLSLYHTRTHTQWMAPDHLGWNPKLYWENHALGILGRDAHQQDTRLGLCFLLEKKTSFHCW